MPRPSTCASSRCRRGCCRTSASATASSTSPPATSARAPRASTTSRPGCRRRARTASSPRRSNCTTYQARRLDIRHRLPADQGGKTQHVATLNGTLATTRWIVALLETHQRADGSVDRARGAAAVPRRPRGDGADRVSEAHLPATGSIKVVKPQEGGEARRAGRSRHRGPDGRHRAAAHRARHRRHRASSRTSR